MSIFYILIFDLLKIVFIFCLRYVFHFYVITIFMRSVSFTEILNKLVMFLMSKYKTYITHYLSRYTFFNFDRNSIHNVY